MPNSEADQANTPAVSYIRSDASLKSGILSNRRILADQMEFLMAHVPKSSRLLI